MKLNENTECCVWIGGRQSMHGGTWRRRCVVDSCCCCRAVLCFQLNRSIDAQHSMSASNYNVSWNRPSSLNHFLTNLSPANSLAIEILFTRVEQNLQHFLTQLTSNLYCSQPPIFTARRYASAVLAVIVCLSVRPSVTSRNCTKMAKPRITLSTV